MKTNLSIKIYLAPFQDTYSEALDPLPSAIRTVIATKSNWLELNNKSTRFYGNERRDYSQHFSVEACKQERRFSFFQGENI